MSRIIKIPKVKEILTEKVVAFRADFSTFDVIKIFNEYRISSAPVVNESNEVVGYLSESDLIKCMGNCLFHDEQRNPTIDSIMSKNVFSVNPEWDIFELDNFFISKEVRSAPVVDSQNHLVGIITTRDTLRALEEIGNERANYKKGLKEPIELSMHQRIKMIINNY